MSVLGTGLRNGGDVDSGVSDFLLFKVKCTFGSLCLFMTGAIHSHVGFLIFGV